MQHLASLHTYQSYVAAAESASSQKQHAAAAAAAVRAVQLALGLEDEDKWRQADQGQTTDSAFQMASVWQGRMSDVQAASLPAQVLAAAAKAEKMELLIAEHHVRSLHADRHQ